MTLDFPHNYKNKIGPIEIFVCCVLNVAKSLPSWLSQFNFSKLEVKLYPFKIHELDHTLQKNSVKKIFGFGSLDTSQLRIKKTYTVEIEIFGLYHLL